MIWHEGCAGEGGESSKKHSGSEEIGGSRAAPRNCLPRLVQRMNRSSTSWSAGWLSAGGTLLWKDREADPGHRGSGRALGGHRGHSPWSMECWGSWLSWLFTTPAYVRRNSSSLAVSCGHRGDTSAPANPETTGCRHQLPGTGTSSQEQAPQQPLSALHTCTTPGLCNSSSSKGTAAKWDIMNSWAGSVSPSNSCFTWLYFQ